MIRAKLLARTYEAAQVEGLEQLVEKVKMALSTTDNFTEEDKTILENKLIEFKPSEIEQLRVLGGKLAGICYMPDDYLSSAIQNVASAKKRADMTTNNGHHSVFDHGNITIQFEGIPKIVAMILNSTQFYTTSEKSARYTLMKPETGLEEIVYKKWTDILSQRIKEVYSNIDEKSALKLAQENARYMISVFTPTVMAYTTSHRQWNYLVDWCDKLILHLEEMTGSFNKRLNESIKEIRNQIIHVIGEKTITDNKERYFEFLPMQHGIKLDPPEVKYENTYETIYEMTFAALAQAQRHRTIHYEMYFNGDNDKEYSFYVPKIIEDNAALTKEWLADMQSVAYCHPQGTKVTVVEQGLAKDFFLKCKERLCGRAQLEIMQNCVWQLKNFVDNSDKLSGNNKIMLNNLTVNGIVPKCGFKDYSCVEGCIWGLKGGLTRKI